MLVMYWTCRRAELAASLFVIRHSKSQLTTPNLSKCAVAYQMATMARNNDTLRTLGIVLLSLTTLPITLAVVCLTDLAHFLININRLRQPKTAHGQRRRTVLVTGVGMTKGLTLARAFHLCGHRVIGADFEDLAIPCPGRMSRAIFASVCG